jgi:hypothetical protein
MTVVSGDCLSCWKWHRELKKWKLLLWPDEPDPDERMARVWLCDECRCLPREELTEHVRWTLENYDVVPDLNDPAIDNAHWFDHDEPVPDRHLKVVSPDGDDDA